MVPHRPEAHTASYPPLCLVKQCLSLPLSVCLMGSDIRSLSGASLVCLSRVPQVLCIPPRTVAYEKYHYLTSHPLFNLCAVPCVRVLLQPPLFTFLESFVRFLPCKPPSLSHILFTFALSWPLDSGVWFPLLPVLCLSCTRCVSSRTYRLCAPGCVHLSVNLRSLL